MKIILWFTRDLRLRDNAALSAAVRDATKNHDALDILPVYIFDTTNPWPVQGAAGWWLHHSLAALANDLSNHGGKLLFLRGDPVSILKKLVGDTGAQAIYFSRAYDSHTANIQQSLQVRMQPTGVVCRRFAGHLMMEPETVLNKQGKPFQVFTPYYNHFRHLMEMHPPPRRAVSFNLRAAKIQSDKLADWRLVPTKPDWAKHFADDWQPGEVNAWHRLRELPLIVADYADHRDFPSMDATSRLSPHLCFGEISPGAIWHYIKSHVTPEKRRSPFYGNWYGASSATPYCTTGLIYRKNPLNRNLKNFPGSATQKNCAPGIWE
jgi:deoxyribodipyrimidine photo-lyase